MLLITLFLAISAQAQKTDSIIDKLKFPKAEAHQGGVLTGAGNTLEQFEKAKNWGIDIVEMDLRLTKDNVPLVFHDEEIHSGRCQGKVSDYTYEEIKQCPKGFGSYKIPSFEEVLLWSNGEIVINAEFKENDVIVPTIKLVQKYNAYEWTYFQTKSHPEKYKIARAEDAKVALLYKPKNVNDIDWILNLNDDRLVVIELFDETATKEMIEKVHAAGKATSYNSWRFDPISEAVTASCDKVFKMGIDIAKTNNPSSCVDQRKKFQ